MQLKRLLVSIIAIALFSTAFAQDKIYKRNGDVVEAKIKSVGTKTVTYLRFDNQSGPEYTILKAEVDRIVYQNGSEDEFNSGRIPRPSRDRDRHEGGPATEAHIAYKTSVLAISPMQFSENGLGVGLSYEKSLDKKGIIAFYLPAAFTLNLNSTYYDYTTGANVNGYQDAMYYVMPGVKIYPTGSFGTVRYAVGPSVVIADGEKSSSNYDPQHGYSNYQTQSHFMLGIIVNNSLNINPSPRIYLGLELGLGFTYMNQVGGLNKGTAFLAQGGFRIGYRF